MSKRFIDTGLFDDPWFMGLSKDGKMLWVYLITKCNHAGLIDLNEKLCKFQTGINNLDTVTKELGNRMIRVKEQLYFMPKFIQFQYPNFPKSNVKQQSSAIDLLSKYGLFDNGMITLTELLPNSYGNGNDNGNDNVKKKSIEILFSESPYIEFEEFSKAMKEYSKGKYTEADMNFYYESVKNWSSSHNKRMVDWIATAANFMIRDIRDNKFKRK